MSSLKSMLPTDRFSSGKRRSPTLSTLTDIICLSDRSTLAGTAGAAALRTTEAPVSCAMASVAGERLFLNHESKCAIAYPTAKLATATVTRLIVKIFLLQFAISVTPSGQAGVFVRLTKSLVHYRREGQRIHCHSARIYCSNRTFHIPLSLSTIAPDRVCQVVAAREGVTCSIM